MQSDSLIDTRRPNYCCGREENEGNLDHRYAHPGDARVGNKDMQKRWRNIEC